MIKYIIIGVLVVAVVTGITVGYNRLEASINETCDLKWKKQIADESDKVEQRVRDRDSKIAELEAKLQVEIDNADAKRRELEAAIDAQRDKIPLSEACLQCRIPRDRIWLRGGPRTTGGPGQGVPGG